MSLANHPAGYRQVTLLLFEGTIAVAPYPPCSELFESLAFPPDPELVPATTEENYYQMFFAVAAVLRPRTYLEIGTRFGYSLVSVARCMATELQLVVSCDLESYENRYALPSQQIAERNLRAAGYTAEARFIVDDSGRIAEHLGGSRFDLILIDGDHSYEGCRSDILNCYSLLEPGGVLMVDDLDIAGVFEAVMDCMRELAGATGRPMFPADETRIVSGPPGLQPMKFARFLPAVLSIFILGMALYTVGFTARMVYRAYCSVIFWDQWHYVTVAMRSQGW